MPRLLFMAIAILGIIAGCAFFTKEYSLAFRGFTPAQMDQMVQRITALDPKGKLHLVDASRPNRHYLLSTERSESELKQLLKQLLTDIGIEGTVSKLEERVEVVRTGYIDRSTGGKTRTVDEKEFVLELERFDARRVGWLGAELRTIHGAVSSQSPTSVGNKAVIVLRAKATESEIMWELNDILSWIGLDGRVTQERGRFLIEGDSSFVKNVSPSAAAPPHADRVITVSHAEGGSPDDYLVRFLNMSDQEIANATQFFPRLTGYRRHEIQNARYNDQEVLLVVEASLSEVARAMRKILWENDIKGQVEEGVKWER